MNAANDVGVLCETELMRHCDVLNTAITSAADNTGRAYDKRTRPRMRKHLGLVQGALISAPISNAVVATVTALDIWRAAADELARRVYDSVTKTVNVPDSTLHNQLPCFQFRARWWI